MEAVSDSISPAVLALRAASLSTSLLKLLLLSPPAACAQDVSSQAWRHQRKVACSSQPTWQFLCRIRDAGGLLPFERARQEKLLGILEVYLGSRLPDAVLWHVVRMAPAAESG